MKLLPFSVGIVCATLLFSGCATLNRMCIGAHAPVYLHIDNQDLAQTEFLVDGKPQKFDMIEYNREIVSSNANSTTWEILSLPAIDIRPKNHYYTLTIKNPNFPQKDILLKRGISPLAYQWLVIDGYLTAGFGTIVDLSNRSLLCLPSVDVNAVRGGSAPLIFRNAATKVALDPAKQ